MQAPVSRARNGADSSPEEGARFQLRDGSWVNIRPIRRDDLARIKKLYEGLSDECIYARHLAYRKQLPEAEAHALVKSDFHTRVVFVATFGEPEDEQVIAIVECSLLDASDPAVAEPAIVVDDRFQGLGLGTRLLIDLARTAFARGVQTFRVTVHPANARMLRFIARSGLRMTRRSEIGSVTIELSLESIPEERELKKAAMAGR